MIDKVLNGRYEIIELIGRGGMAYVYKAKDLKLNREVAVKVLREEYTENEQFIKKFDRESQAAAGLSHPNIVSVYDVGVQDNIYYIIMEYVDGITLKQYLNQKGTLDYVEATQYILEIAGALKCAHEHKIIHRDIKPHNILLTKELVPKVADFGIARAITSSTVTVTNQTMGSVHYISPEQARGGFVDEYSDLYSLGIMYYELLTGQLPFDAESSVSIAIKHIQEPITPPKNLNDSIPDSVNEVVLKLTQKKPEDRYQNAQELMEDLNIMLDDFEATLPNNPVQTAPLDGFDGDLFTVEDGGVGTYGGYSGEDLDYEPESRDLKYWVIAGLVFLALLIGGALYAANSIFNNQVMVPDVANMALAEAEAELTKAGLITQVESETYDSEVPQGNVISQTPTQGSQVREGSTVRLVVSQGVRTVAVPQVTGQSEESANSELVNMGFNVDIQREFNSNYDSGVVFSVEPASGTELAQGDKVTIFVSKGENTVTVPGIIGLAQSDAENRLITDGLKPGTVTQQTNSVYPAGVIINQSPSEGRSVERGTYVSFVVSSGPPSSSTSTSTPNYTNPSTTENGSGSTSTTPPSSSGSGSSGTTTPSGNGGSTSSGGTGGSGTTNPSGGSGNSSDYNQDDVYNSTGSDSADDHEDHDWDDTGEAIENSLRSLVSPTTSSQEGSHDHE